MKSSFPRPLSVPTVLALGALLAGCGGGGGATVAPIERDCCFVYADPIVLPAPLVGPDPLLARQWHLRNTGQTFGTPGEDLNVAGPLGAWALGTNGSGVRIAIVDDAIETAHPDLAPGFVFVNGLFHNYRIGAAPGSLPLPYWLDDDHGTAIAGLALARDGNAIGGAGVAPRAELAAYNPLATNYDADIADALLRSNATIDIYNNSWGSPDNGMLNAAESSFAASIEAGIANGRGGKGSIYVFAGGNGGCYLRSPADVCIAENANLDGYLNKRGVITTCAVDDNGRAPYYAEPGANILVCGRSGTEFVGLTTTTPQSDYRHDFSGTSASTPTVSGVVALMLQARPDLTWRDVQLVLAKSARRNDPTDPGWVSFPGLKDRHPRYGFGAVDAAAAVTMARTWSSVGNSAALQSCTVARGPDAAGFPKVLPMSGDANPTRSVTDVADLGSCAITRVEFVEVRFSATHNYSGDLEVKLTSPNGLESLLANGRRCDTNGDGVADDCGSYDDWAFGSVRHLDESAAGQWSLSVRDTDPADNPGAADPPNRWTAWRLTVWGR